MFGGVTISRDANIVGNVKADSLTLPRKHHVLRMWTDERVWAQLWPEWLFFVLKNWAHGSLTQYDNCLDMARNRSSSTEFGT